MVLQGIYLNIFILVILVYCEIELYESLDYLIKTLFCFETKFIIEL